MIADGCQDLSVISAEGGEGDQALVQPTTGLVLNITPIIAASERCN